MSGIAVELLDWDSRFFGLRIGRLTQPPASASELGGALEAARGERIDCVYAVAPAEAIESAWILESAGFVVRDLRLDFARAVADAPSTGAARAWSEADLAALERIAEVAFTGTRFAADPTFSRDAVRNLYRTWIANSCRGFADAVLVDGPDGDPFGFATLHREKHASHARIGLIGIGAAHRAQGVGSRLVAAALGWAAEQGCDRLHVATQANNVGAQRLYQRNGFTTVSATAWYHLWTNKDPHPRATA